VSANPAETLPTFPVMNKPTSRESPSRLERRSRVRTTVHWPVQFFRHSADVIESLTRNLSCGGFYCLAEAALTPGEFLICTLEVPAHDPTGKETTRLLECKTRVVRVDPRDRNGFFGIACRIEDYRFVCGCVDEDSGKSASRPE